MKTSRERLTDTLNHKDPGKVVTDLGSTPITGIHAAALTRVKQALGLSGTVKIGEPFQLLGEVEEDVRQALGIDIVGVTDGRNMFGFANEGWKPWKLQSGEEVLVPGGFNTTVDQNGSTYLYPQGDLSAPPSAKMPAGGYFFDNITRSEGEFDEDNADARADFADDFGVYTDERLRAIEKRCADLYDNTEYGLIGGGGLIGLGDFALVPGPGVKHPKGIRNLEDFIVAHHTMPDYIHDLFGMQTETGLKNAALFYQAVGNRIQAMQVSGTDFGTQCGPYMSPDSYREFYKPYHRQVNDWIHAHTEWKTFFHSCGAITDFLPDFGEIGVDILNPVQTSAAGMDAKTLKERWGETFTFWGGSISTQQTLPFGTPEEVYNETLATLAIFAPGGGFVCNTIHNIQANTPTENILAFFNAVKAYNKDK